MKVAILVLCLVAVAIAAPSKRQDILNIIAQEQQKYVECEQTHTKAECDSCCSRQAWAYPYEEIGCHGVCFALPLVAAGGSQ